MNESEMTDAEIDVLLERFDQTEPKLQRRIIARFVCEVEKLKKFKEYVHGRLDAAGVPTDPESPHKAEGCRIGGRLDIVLAGHQADDDAPVTPEWLADAGFGLNSAYADIPIDNAGGWTLFLRVRFFSMEASICHYEMSTSESDGLALTKTKLTTRGHVRRLCAALGVPLHDLLHNEQPRVGKDGE